MTGSAELAKKIFRAQAHDHIGHRGATEAGFKFLSSGGTREVYLGPDGVVYKVGDPECNLREAKATRRLRGNRKLLSYNIHIPRARTYRVDGDYHVVAMDYIKSVTQVKCKSYDDYEYKTDWYEDACNCGGKGGVHVCFGKLHHFMDNFGIDDMFRGNIHYAPDNRFYIIDLGYQDHDYDYS